MPSYSRSGSHYASVARLLNCLIACLVMATVGLVALPSFLPFKSKSPKLAKGSHVRMRSLKLVTATKNRVYRSPGGPVFARSKGAAATGKVPIGKYGSVGEFKALGNETITASIVLFDLSGLSTSRPPLPIPRNEGAYSSARPGAEDNGKDSYGHTSPKKDALKEKEI
jgi:hypothetical protein